MQMIAFDTHGFVKKLTKAGMPEPQAEVLASEQSRLIENELATKQDIAEVKRDIEQLRLATKQDIAEVKRDIEQLRQDTKRDMKELETTLKRDIEASRAEAKKDIAEVKRDIEASKADILKWMFGALLGQTAILGTLIKFL